MLHEFAIDPTCAPSLDALRRILDQCALHLGRYVSDFPRRRWECEVRRHLQSQSWQAGKRLESTLIDLKRRRGLIDTGRKYDSDARRTWLDNALQEHGIREFRAIVSEASPGGRDFVLAAEELDSGTRRWNVETQGAIPRTAEALVACVAPLIRLSQRILLVDPHFCPDTVRYQQALEALLLSAHGAGRSSRRWELHTKVQVKPATSDEDRKKWIRTFKEDCHKYLPRHIPHDLPLQVILWRDRPDGEVMHARYVMTELGAIGVEKGLDVGAPGQTTDVSLLQPELYRRRWDELQRESQTYEFVAQMTIVGARSGR